MSHWLLFRVYRVKPTLVFWAVKAVAIKSEIVDLLSIQMPINRLAVSLNLYQAWWSIEVCCFSTSKRLS
jgi:hypothetical protein